VEAKGWDYLDIIIFSGDAYVDHPSFGAAVIGRVLEKEGYKVAIVPQPNWRDDLRDFKKLGKPRLFFGVTSGAMDSMINHYTANLRLRSNDSYTPGGKAGQRPDYAVTVYSSILKNLFPDTPVVIGGIEASLRRFAHFDYWSGKLKPSVLIESKADILVYGMGEKPILDVARALKKKDYKTTIRSILQIAYLSENNEQIEHFPDRQTVELFSFEEALADKIKHAKNFKIIEEESNKMVSRRIIETHGKQKVVVNPTNLVASEKDLDAIFDLPFTRLPHPRYTGKEPIPAYEMIRHSINIHRGCFGGCSFCTISAHQGKFVTSRSEKSILKEVDKVIQMPDFKGFISDLGGPSANMYKMSGMDLTVCDKCKRPSCIYPAICKNLNTNHIPLTELYKKVREINGIKKVTIGSGIRYDLIVNPLVKNKSYQEYITELLIHHVSGRLKIAPEHSELNVLRTMRKPSFDLFKQFKAFFDSINNSYQLNQQLIPYFISSHPGCQEADMASLASETIKINYQPEQVQDFTPTPLTLSTTMFYTGVDPYTLKKVYTAKSNLEKQNQNLYFFWYKKENREIIRKRLAQIGRKDLIHSFFKKR